MIWNVKYAIVTMRLYFMWWQSLAFWPWCCPWTSLIMSNKRVQHFHARKAQVSVALWSLAFVFNVVRGCCQVANSWIAVYRPVNDELACGADIWRMHCKYNFISSRLLAKPKCAQQATDLRNSSLLLLLVLKLLPLQ